MNLYRAIGVTTRIANVSMTGRVATCHPICMSELGKLQLGKHHGLAKGWFPPPSVKQKTTWQQFEFFHLEIVQLSPWFFGNLMIQILKGETSGHLCTNPPSSTQFAMTSCLHWRVEALLRPLPPWVPADRPMEQTVVIILKLFTYAYIDRAVICHVCVPLTVNETPFSVQEKSRLHIHVSKKYQQQQQLIYS